MLICMTFIREDDILKNVGNQTTLDPSLYAGKHTHGDISQISLGIKASAKCMNVKVMKLLLKMIELFQIMKLINKMAFLQSR